MATISCFDISVLRGIPSLKKIILVNYVFGNQSYINEILTKYSKIRDFHHNPPHLATIIQINDFIAKSVNHTIVSTLGMKPNCSIELLKRTPSLNYFVFAHQLKDVYNDSAFTIQRFDQPFSFTYCDHPRTGPDSLSPFILFHESADTAVWFCLIASIVLISVLVKNIAGHNTWSTCLITLSALISGGVSISIRALQHSWLLTVWMCMCLIFVTYYSGNLTSEVISPTPEFRYSTLAELVLHKYTFIVNPFAYAVMKREVKTGGLLKQVETIKSIISATEVVNFDDVPQLLITKSHCATLFIWPHAFKDISKAYEFQAKSKMHQKHCYIGKELFFDESLYMVVSRPKIPQVDRVLRILMEQGIFNIWMKEYVGVSGSIRVQDRSRIISSTKFRENPKVPKSLNLKEGKLRNVFVLWMGCLLIAGIGCLVELCQFASWEGMFLV